jgi:hypothetical protein
LPRREVDSVAVGTPAVGRPLAAAGMAIEAIEYVASGSRLNHRNHIVKLRSLLPRDAAAGRNAVPEKKAAGIFMSLAGRASWTGRSYAALSREGFMKHPVAHRSVRLITEAAATPMPITRRRTEPPKPPRRSRPGSPDITRTACGWSPISTRLRSLR